MNTNDYEQIAEEFSESFREFFLDMEDRMGDNFFSKWSPKEQKELLATFAVMVIRFTLELKNKIPEREKN